MFFISVSNNRESFSKQNFNRYLNPYPYLLILLSLNLIFFPSINHLLGLQQLNPKILALNVHHIRLSLTTMNIFQSKNLMNILIFILIILLILLGLQQLNLLFL